MRGFINHMTHPIWMAYVTSVSSGCSGVRYRAHCERSLSLAHENNARETHSSTDTTPRHTSVMLWTTRRYNKTTHHSHRSQYSQTRCHWPPFQFTERLSVTMRSGIGTKLYETDRILIYLRFYTFLLFVIRDVICRLCPEKNTKIFFVISTIKLGGFW